MLIEYHKRCAYPYERVLLCMSLNEYCRHGESIFTSIACIVNGWTQTLSLFCSASTSSALSPPHLLFSEIEDRLFIVGGLNKSIMSSVELYDFKTSAWAPVSNLPFDKFLCGDASAIGAWLYVLRGEVDGNVSSSPSFCLNTVTGQILEATQSKTMYVLNCFTLIVETA